MENYIKNCDGSKCNQCSECNEQKEDKVIGYCSHCGTSIYLSNRIEKRDIFECSECYYPNSLDDLCQ